VSDPDFSEYLAEAGRLVAGATAHIAGVRACIHDFKRYGLVPRAAREILKTLESTLQELQDERDIIARLIELGFHPT
jgi:hypothetical protein